jgi:hypothetical protein
VIFQLNQHFITWFEPVFQSLKFCAAFSLLSLGVWTLISAMIDVVSRAKQMHQIPCTKCRFFTQDYRLKCTVKPHIANTEQAIHCSDYLGDQ